MIKLYVIIVWLLDYSVKLGSSCLVAVWWIWTKCFLLEYSNFPEYLVKLNRGNLYLARRDGCPVCRVWCVECGASATVQSLIRLLVGGQCPLSQVVTGPPLHHLHQTDTPHMYLLPNVTWIINIHFLPHTSVWNLCTELFCFWATFDNVADAAGEIFLSI